MADKINRGREIRGEARLNSLLTESEVIEARLAFVRGSRKFGVPSLAMAYNISVTPMRYAVEGRTWSHVKMPEMDADQEAQAQHDAQQAVLARMGIKPTTPNR